MLKTAKDKGLNSKLCKSRVNLEVQEVFFSCHMQFWVRQSLFVLALFVSSPSFKGGYV